MRAFKTKSFARWARKAGVTDKSLLEAASEMETGLVEARLGGSLFKKRLARPGSGKSMSFRVIAAGAPRQRWVFLNGFGKNERDDIDVDELRALKQIATVLLTMAPIQIEHALKAGELVELSDG